METNISMKALLLKYKIEIMDATPHSGAFSIWRKKDEAGRAYWGVASFCGLDNHSINADQDLSQLEWDGNEVHLDARAEDDVPDMLRTALGILSFWKSEMSTKYPDTAFYLFASYDNGDMLALDEGESPVRSITLRFWADRGGNSVINLSYFNEWEQPAIIEYCNF